MAPMPPSSSRTPRSVRWPRDFRHRPARRGSRSAARRSCRRHGTPATGVAVGPPAPTPVPTPVPALAPGFAWTGSMTTDDGGPLGESATLLADGRVLFAGGCSTAAELYDPATGTFTPTGDMTACARGRPRRCCSMAASCSPAGTTVRPAGQDGIWASAELYDPATGTFSPTGSMAARRESSSTATRLADGRVLIAGGYHGPQARARAGGITLASYRLVEVRGQRAQDRRAVRPGDRHVQPDRFDELHSRSSTRRRCSRTAGSSSSAAAARATPPEDGRPLRPGDRTFSRTGSMKTGRWLHTATLLEDGRVLIVGRQVATGFGLRVCRDCTTPRPASSGRPARWVRADSSTPRRCSPTVGSSSPAATGATGRSGESCPRPRCSTLPPGTSARSARWARPARATPRRS